jgi:hypothetical protein
MMSDLLKALVGVLNGSEYDSQARALLYSQGKREDLLQAECLRIIRSESQSNLSRTEFPLKQEDIRVWNEALRRRGYFADKSGLPTKKQRGRIDVVGFSHDETLSHLIEVKAWSAGDAVDVSRYRSGKKSNHSISKSFEIDALKMLSVQPGEMLRRSIVTAMFTIHCDGMPKSELEKRGFPFLDLLMKQNRDRAKIGGSDDYRRVGLELMLAELCREFGPGTAMNAQFSHVSAFGRADANFKGVGISLDLVYADLGTVAVDSIGK